MIELIKNGSPLKGPGLINVSKQPREAETTEKSRKNQYKPRAEPLENSEPVLGNALLPSNPTTTTTKVMVFLYGCHKHVTHPSPWKKIGGETDDYFPNKQEGKLTIPKNKTTSY